MSDEQPFWAGGIAFECQETGRCCTSRGEYGYIYLTRADRRRLAEHLGMELEDFVRRHCQTTEGHLHLKEPDKDCMFLKERRCSVYEARPSQCRTWPFWPENMNPRTWSEEIASFCPGVGKGRRYSAEEIEELVQLGKASTAARPR